MVGVGLLTAPAFLIFPACTALAAEIRIEHDCFTESAASGTKKISPDYGLVESLCGLLCGMVEGIYAEKIETYLDNELREVVALMALAMDMMRKARRVERMKLLGDSYVGLQPDSLMDTDSDAGSEDSMSDHDDADAGFAAHDSNSMPDDHDARAFHAGTNDEDKYVNPDEGVIVDRGKQRACFMSLRA